MLHLLQDNRSKSQTTTNRNPPQIDRKVLRALRASKVFYLIEDILISKG
jgi:hypothetical protein